MHTLHSPRAQALSAMTNTPARTTARTSMFGGLRLLPILVALLPFAAPVAHAQQMLARDAATPAALAAPATNAVGMPVALTAATMASPAGEATPMVTAATPVVAGAVAAQPVALQARSFAPAEAPRAPKATKQSSTALMIVGFAAMIVGAVVDGDAGTLIMVGGAGVGLYGLYHYLN